LLDRFFRVCCLFVHSFLFFSYVNSSISSQHTAASLDHIFLRNKAYSIKVEFLILSQESSSYMAHRHSHTDRTAFFFRTQNLKNNFYIILASLLLFLLLPGRFTFFFILQRFDIQEPQRYYNEISFMKISSDSEF
jgi:hypothetical protein